MVYDDKKKGLDPLKTDFFNQKAAGSNSNDNAHGLPQSQGKLTEIPWRDVVPTDNSDLSRFVPEGRIWKNEKSGYTAWMSSLQDSQHAGYGYFVHFDEQGKVVGQTWVSLFGVEYDDRASFNSIFMTRSSELLTGLSPNPFINGVTSFNLDQHVGQTVVGKGVNASVTAFGYATNDEIVPGINAYMPVSIGLHNGINLRYDPDNVEVSYHHPGIVDILLNYDPSSESYLSLKDMIDDLGYNAPEGTYRLIRMTLPDGRTSESFEEITHDLPLEQPGTYFDTSVVGAAIIQTAIMPDGSKIPVPWELGGLHSATDKTTIKTDPKNSSIPEGKAAVTHVSVRLPLGSHSIAKATLYLGADADKLATVPPALRDQGNMPVSAATPKVPSSAIYALSETEDKNPAVFLMTGQVSFTFNFDKNFNLDKKSFEDVNFNPGAQGALLSTLDNKAIKDEKGNVIGEYADKSKAVHLTKNTWMGRLDGYQLKGQNKVSAQEGTFLIGEGGKISGDVALITANGAFSKTTTAGEELKFDQLDIVMRVDAEGGNRPDWHLSYAKGTATIEGRTSEIFDLGTSILNDANKSQIPTLGIRSQEQDIAIPEHQVKAPAAGTVNSVNGPEIIASSFAPELRLNKVTLEPDSQIRTNLAKGRTGVLLNPIVDQEGNLSYFDRGGNFTFASLDISTLSLGPLATWNNVAQFSVNKKGEIIGDSVKIGDKYLLALSTTTSADGKRIRTSAGLLPGLRDDALQVGRSHVEVTETYLPEVSTPVHKVGENLPVDQKKGMTPEKKIPLYEGEAPLASPLQEAREIMDTAVRYSVKSWAELRVRDEQGNLSLPMQDVLWGENVKNEHTLGYEIGKLDPLGKFIPYGKGEKTFKGNDLVTTGESSLVRQKAATQDKQTVALLGWQELPFISQGLRQATVVKDGKGEVLTDAKPLALNSDYAYKIGDRKGGVLIPEGTATFVQMGLNEQGVLSFSPVSTAGKLTYEQAQVSRAEGSKLITGLKHSGALAIPFGLNVEVDAKNRPLDFTITYLGGDKSKSFAFDDAGNLKAGVGRLLAQYDVRPDTISFKTQPVLSQYGGEPVEGEIKYAAPVIYKYEELAKDKKGQLTWQSPNKVYFDNGLGFKVYENTGKENAGKNWVVRDVVFQATDMEKGVLEKTTFKPTGKESYYGIKMLSLLLAGIADVKGATSQERHKLANVNELYMRQDPKTEIVSVEKGIVPVQMGISQGKLQFQPLADALNTVWIGPQMTNKDGDVTRGLSILYSVFNKDGVVTTLHLGGENSNKVFFAPTGQIEGLALSEQRKIKIDGGQVKPSVFEFLGQGGRAISQKVIPTIMKQDIGEDGSYGWKPASGHYNFDSLYPDAVNLKQQGGQDAISLGISAQSDKATGLSGIHYVLSAASSEDKESANRFMAAAFGSASGSQEATSIPNLGYNPETYAKNALLAQFGFNKDSNNKDKFFFSPVLSYTIKGKQIQEAKGEGKTWIGGVRDYLGAEISGWFADLNAAGARINGLVGATNAQKQSKERARIWREVRNESKQSAINTLNSSGTAQFVYQGLKETSGIIGAIAIDPFLGLAGYTPYYARTTSSGKAIETANQYIANTVTRIYETSFKPIWDVDARERNVAIHGEAQKLLVQGITGAPVLAKVEESMEIAGIPTLGMTISGNAVVSLVKGVNNTLVGTGYFIGSLGGSALDYTSLTNGDSGAWMRKFALNKFFGGEGENERYEFSNLEYAGGAVLSALNLTGIYSLVTAPGKAALPQVIKGVAKYSAAVTIFDAAATTYYTGQLPSVESLAETFGKNLLPGAGFFKVAASLSSLSQQLPIASKLLNLGKSEVVNGIEKIIPGTLNFAVKHPVITTSIGTTATALAVTGAYDIAGGNVSVRDYATVGTIAASLPFIAYGGYKVLPQATGKFFNLGESTVLKAAEKVIPGILSFAVKHPLITTSIGNTIITEAVMGTYDVSSYIANGSSVFSAIDYLTAGVSAASLPFVAYGGYKLATSPLVTRTLANETGSITILENTASKFLPAAARQFAINQVILQGSSLRATGELNTDPVVNLLTIVAAVVSVKTTAFSKVDSKGIMGVIQSAVDAAAIGGNFSMRANMIIGGLTGKIPTAQAMVADYWSGAKVGAFTGVTLRVLGLGAQAFNTEGVANFATKYPTLLPGLAGGVANLVSGWYRGDVNSLSDAGLYFGTGYLAGNISKALLGFKANAGDVLSNWPVLFSTLSTVSGGVAVDLLKVRSGNAIALDAAENVVLGYAMGRAAGSYATISRFFSAPGNSWYNVTMQGLKQASAVVIGGGLGLGIAKDAIRDFNKSKIYSSETDEKQHMVLTSPGGYINSFLNGGMWTLVLAYGFKSTGREQGVSILQRLEPFAGSAHTRKQIIAGMIDWPIVTFVMEAVKPVVDYGISWGLSKILGNKEPVYFRREVLDPISGEVKHERITGIMDYINNYIIGLETNQDGSRQFSQTSVLKNTILSSLPGMYMGPTLGLLSRAPTDLIDRAVTKGETKLTGWEITRIINDRYPSISKVVGAPEAVWRGLSSWIKKEGFWNGLDTQVFGKSKTNVLLDYNILPEFITRQGGTLSLHKLFSLTDVALFVEAVNSGIDAMGAVGALVDYRLGNTAVKDQINKEGLTLDYLRQNYSTMGAFEKDKFAWTALLIKPSLTIGRAEIFMENKPPEVEGGREVFDAKKSRENLQTVREEVVKHGSFEAAIKDATTQTYKIFEQRRNSAISSSSIQAKEDLARAEREAGSATKYADRAVGIAERAQSRAQDAKAQNQGVHQAERAAERAETKLAQATDRYQEAQLALASARQEAGNLDRSAQEIISKYDANNSDPTIGNKARTVLDNFRLAKVALFKGDVTEYQRLTKKAMNTAGQSGHNFSLEAAKDEIKQEQTRSMIRDKIIQAIDNKGQISITERGAKQLFERDWKDIPSTVSVEVEVMGRRTTLDVPLRNTMLLQAGSILSERARVENKLVGKDVIDAFQEVYQSGNTENIMQAENRLEQVLNTNLSSFVTYDTIRSIFVSQEKDNIKSLAEAHIKGKEKGYYQDFYRIRQERIESHFSGSSAADVVSLQERENKALSRAQNKAYSQQTMEEVLRVTAQRLDKKENELSFEEKTAARKRWQQIGEQVRTGKIGDT